MPAFPRTPGSQVAQNHLFGFDSVLCRLRGCAWFSWSDTLEDLWPALASEQEHWTWFHGHVTLALAVKDPGAPLWRALPWPPSLGTGENSTGGETEGSLRRSKAQVGPPPTPGRSLTLRLQGQHRARATPSVTGLL